MDNEIHTVYTRDGEYQMTVEDMMNFYEECTSPAITTTESKPKQETCQIAILNKYGTPIDVFNIVSESLSAACRILDYLREEYSSIQIIRTTQYD